MDTIPLRPGDPAYPPALTALAERQALLAPTLYLRGSLPRAPGVTVVGTRAPSEEARAFTRELVLGLCAEGFAIWSGGARGIDAVAHEAALEAGAPTVVALGGGLARPYPHEHVPLFDRILASGGALLARVPDPAPPTPAGFLLRNELLAALGAATIVVQAGLKSGARSTAAAARRLGRPLCVVPHPPWDPSGAGCALELARGGARAIVSTAEVLEAISRTDGAVPPPALARARKRRPRPAGRSRENGPDIADLSEDERLVLGAIGATPVHLDEIRATVGLPVPRIQVTLLTLTLGAVVVEGPAGFYRQASRP